MKIIKHILNIIKVILGVFCILMCIAALFTIKTKVLSIIVFFLFAVSTFFLFKPTKKDEQKKTNEYTMNFSDLFKIQKSNQEHEALKKECESLKEQLTLKTQDALKFEQEIFSLRKISQEKELEKSLLSEAISEKDKELETLKKDVKELKKLITPEIQDALTLKQEICSLQKTYQEEELKKIYLSEIIDKKRKESENLDSIIKEKRKNLIVLDDDLLVQEFGLYQPKFNFACALDYKEKLIEIRAEQKDLIKNGQAVAGSNNWEVNGSLSKGKKMISDTQKLLLRAFNSECDELVEKIKYTNFDSSLNKIYKSAEAISKLGNIMNISITQRYLSAKVKELRLAFEYQLQKQKEKEELREAKAEQREQAKIQKELDEQRKKIEKEQTHYQTAFSKLKTQLELNPNNQDLLEKKTKLENQLSDIDKALTDIDYRQANIKAGYVYIISNIGAFGENIYKIGMTRRLEPQDRIDELGNASVPFNFDVHAMIFSDNAPALEASLHRAFEDKKLNMVNHRREFFNVTLDEIKEVVRKNFDKTVEFIDVPDADQYRVSLKMKTQNNNSI